MSCMIQTYGNFSVGSQDLPYQENIGQEVEAKSSYPTMDQDEDRQHH